MSDKNMALWELVSKTPSHHIKEINTGGQKRKTVKAAFQKQKATEVFGIYGLDWGPVVGSERYERTQLADTALLHYTATMFFNFGDRRGEFPIAATVSEGKKVNRGKQNEYYKVDEEAIKKVRTDALTKGLSELGFNADIFQGLHDSANYSVYVDEVLNEEITEKAEQDQIKQAEEYAEWKSKELKVYSSLNTVRAVTTAHTGHVRRATKINDVKAVKEFTEARDKRIEELKEAAKND